MTTRFTGAYFSIAGLLTFTSHAWAQSGGQGFEDELAHNIWTNFQFGPNQLLWFAGAVVLGFLVYFSFYRALLPVGLRRVPNPLSPGRHGLSALACAILFASLILAVAGFGFAYVAGLMVMAGILDWFSGRFWIFWLGPTMALGLCIYGFLFH